MTELAELLTDCKAHGIRLLPAGDDGLTIDAPQDALTPALLERLKAHKEELLAALRPKANDPRIDPTDAATLWQPVLDRPAGGPPLPIAIMEALPAADLQWASHEIPQGPVDDSALEAFGPDGWPANSIDADELDACAKCGGLNLWKSAAGDLSGLTPGNWRCRRCDPPTTARRLAELAKRIRQRKI